MNNHPMMSVYKSDKVQEEMKNAITCKGFSLAALASSILLYYENCDQKQKRALQECSSASKASCFVCLASLGLYPSKETGHAYIIPYGRNCTISVGYRGFITLSHRIGYAVRAYEVREKDHLSIEMGDTIKIAHRLNPPFDSEIVAYYAYAAIESESSTSIKHVATINKADLANIKKCSRSSQFSSPWHTFESEMGKKSAIRRLIKYLPTHGTVIEIAENTENKHFSFEQSKNERQSLPPKLQRLIKSAPSDEIKDTVAKAN